MVKETSISICNDNEKHYKKITCKSKNVYVLYNIDVIVKGECVSFILEIKVTPQSGKEGFVFDKNGVIKCYLKSPAEKGLANRELIKIIAQKLKIPQDSVELLSGHTSRNKRVKIAKNFTFDEFLAAIGLARQQKLF